MLYKCKSWLPFQGLKKLFFFTQIYLKYVQKVHILGWLAKSLVDCGSELTTKLTDKTGVKYNLGCGNSVGTT